MSMMHDFGHDCRCGVGKSKKWLYCVCMRRYSLEAGNKKKAFASLVAQQIQKASRQQNKQDGSRSVGNLGRFTNPYFLDNRVPTTRCCQK